MKYLQRWVACIFLTLVAIHSRQVRADHTGIGSGGDVIEAYLEETRARFIEALNQFQIAPSKIQGRACANQGLDVAMEQDCLAILRAVATGMANLHVGSKRVLFELSKDPVMVEGADGKPRRVAAKTLTGPEGSVTFDYALIMHRTPKLMMALVAHETGHKVEFRHSSGRNYIEDDAPVLHFATGRALLDAAGLAIGNFAEQTGIIGESFLVRDKYFCEIKPTGSDIGFYQSGDDVREFTLPDSDTAPFDAYRTGVGESRSLQIGVTQGNTCLSLYLMLYESSGCRSNQGMANRRVELKIYRLFRPQRDGSVKEPEILSEDRIEQWNPTCEVEKIKRERPMIIEAEGLTFSCTYKGMQAGTHAAFFKATNPKVANSCPAN